MVPPKCGSWLAMLVGACATSPPSTLDADVVPELRQLDDVLSRPHEFVAGACRRSSQDGNVLPFEYGCTVPWDFLPDPWWERTGRPVGTVWNRAIEPSEEPCDADDPVTRACWRVEQLGCAGLFRRRLLRILGDAELGAAMRCQAARALGTLQEVETAAAMARAIGDEVIGPACLDALARLGHVALEALRRAALPDDEPARARAIWLLGRNDEELGEPELRWLVAALGSVSHKEAVWTLARVGARGRTREIADLLVADLKRDGLPPAALALIAIARIDEPRLRTEVLTIVERGEGVRRQLALQCLGVVQSPAGFDTVLACASDGAQPPADRAAAMLALGGYTCELSRWIDVARRLLDDGDVHLVRAAMRALSLQGSIPKSVLARVRELKRATRDPDIGLHALEILQRNR